MQILTNGLISGLTIAVLAVAVSVACLPTCAFLHRAERDLCGRSARGDVQASTVACKFYRCAVWMSWIIPLKHLRCQI
jgi:hypothetical protein